jgi:hypothetical protein
MRKLGFAIVFMIVFVAVGTIGGFYDVHDAINRVTVSTIENDYGGETYMKMTNDDKVATWTEYYDATLTPTLNEQKAYFYSEATDAENYIIQYTINYMSDGSVDDIINYYTGFYGEVELDENSQGDKYISAFKDGFNIYISIEDESEGRDVMITATHQSVDA